MGVPDLRVRAFKQLVRIYFIPSKYTRIQYACQQHVRVDIGYATLGVPPN